MVTIAVQAGATTINIPDTVGYTTPAEFEAEHYRQNNHVADTATQ